MPPQLRGGLPALPQDSPGPFALPKSSPMGAEGFEVWGSPLASAGPCGCWDGECLLKRLFSSVFVIVDFFPFFPTGWLSFAA